MHKYSSQLRNTRVISNDSVNGRKYAGFRHLAHCAVSQPVMLYCFSGRPFRRHRRASFTCPKRLYRTTEKPPSGASNGSSVLQESLFRMTVMRMSRSDCDIPAKQSTFFHVMTVVFPYSVFCFAVFHCQNFLLPGCINMQYHMLLCEPCQ